jgi:hypothetical protein
MPAEFPTSGSGGGAAPIVHDQSVAAAEWLVDHNLGSPPSAVRVVDTSGRTVMGEVTDETVNRVRLNFTAPFSGKAYVSP